MSNGDELSQNRRRLYDLIPGGSTSQPSGTQPEHQPIETTSTTVSNPSATEGISNFRSYVTEIDHTIDLYRSGERTKIEAVSAITQFLLGDKDLSPEERSRR